MLSYAECFFTALFIYLFKKVLNLKLVDLSQNIPVSQKTQSGINHKTSRIKLRNMIIEFIRKDNCLILAVSPANSDLAYSDALKLAREVDPSGDRTIGVITKLDLMDRGTDACDILMNRVKALKLGYVGVVNRSEDKINQDIKFALEKEKIFVSSHPKYKYLHN